MNGYNSPSASNSSTNEDTILKIFDFVKSSLLESKVRKEWYFCDLCYLFTTILSNWNDHLKNLKHLELVKSTPELVGYSCNKCNGTLVIDRCKALQYLFSRQHVELDSAASILENPQSISGDNSAVPKAPCSVGSVKDNSLLLCLNKKFIFLQRNQNDGSRNLVMKKYSLLKVSDKRLNISETLSVLRSMRKFFWSPQGSLIEESSKYDPNEFFSSCIQKIKGSSFEVPFCCIFCDKIGLFDKLNFLHHLGDPLHYCAAEVIKNVEAQSLLLCKTCSAIFIGNLNDWYAHQYYHFMEENNTDGNSSEDICNTQSNLIECNTKSINQAFTDNCSIHSESVSIASEKKSIQDSNAEEHSLPSSANDSANKYSVLRFQFSCDSNDYELLFYNKFYNKSIVGSRDFLKKQTCNKTVESDVKRHSPLSRLCGMNRYLLQFVNSKLEFTLTKIKKTGTAVSLRDTYLQFITQNFMEFESKSNLPPLFCCLLCEFGQKWSMVDLLIHLDSSTHCINEGNLAFWGSKIVVLLCKICGVFLLCNLGDCEAHTFYHRLHNTGNLGCCLSKCNESIQTSCSSSLLEHSSTSEAIVDVNSQNMQSFGGSQGNIKIQATSSSTAELKTENPETDKHPHKAKNSSVSVGSSQNKIAVTQESTMEVKRSEFVVYTSESLLKQCHILSVSNVNEELALSIICDMNRYLLEKSGSFKSIGSVNSKNVKNSNIKILYTEYFLKTLQGYPTFFECITCGSGNKFTIGSLKGHFTEGKHYSNHNAIKSCSSFLILLSCAACPKRVLFIGTPHDIAFHAADHFPNVNLQILKKDLKKIEKKYKATNFIEKITDNVKSNDLIKKEVVESDFVGLLPFLKVFSFKENNMEVMSFSDNINQGSTSDFFNVINNYFNSKSASFVCSFCDFTTSLSEPEVIKHCNTDTHVAGISKEKEFKLLLCSICEVVLLAKQNDLVDHCDAHVQTSASNDNESKFVEGGSGSNKKLQSGLEIYSLVINTVDASGKIVSGESTFSARKAVKVADFSSHDYFHRCIGNYFGWKEVALQCMICQRASRFRKESLISDVTSKEHQNEKAALLAKNTTVEMLLCNNCRTIYVGTPQQFSNHIERHRKPKESKDGKPIQDPQLPKEVDRNPQRSRLKSVSDELDHDDEDQDGEELMENYLTFSLTLRDLTLLAVHGSQQFHGDIGSLLDFKSVNSMTDEKAFHIWLDHWNPGFIGYTCTVCSNGCEPMEKHQFLKDVSKHLEELKIENFVLFSCSECRSLCFIRKSELVAQDHKTHLKPILPVEQKFKLLLEYMLARYSCEPFCNKCGSAYYCSLCLFSTSHHLYWEKHINSEKHVKSLNVLNARSPTLIKCSLCGLFIYLLEEDKALLNSELHVLIDSKFPNFSIINEGKFVANCKRSLKNLKLTENDFLSSVYHSACHADCEFSIIKKAISLCFQSPLILFDVDISTVIDSIKEYEYHNAPVIRSGNLKYKCLDCEPFCVGKFIDIENHLLICKWKNNNALENVNRAFFLCPICLTLFISSNSKSLEVNDIGTGNCNHKKLFNLVKEFIEKEALVKMTHCLLDTVEEYLARSYMKCFLLKNKLLFCCNICNSKFPNVKRMRDHATLPQHLLKNVGMILLLCYHCGRVSLYHLSSNCSSVCRHMVRCIRSFKDSSRDLKRLPVVSIINAASGDDLLAQCPVVTSSYEQFLLLFPVPSQTVPRSIMDCPLWQDVPSADALARIIGKPELSKFLCNMCCVRFKSMADFSEHLSSNLHEYNCYSCSGRLQLIPIACYCLNCEEVIVFGNMYSVHAHMRSYVHKENENSTDFEASPFQDKELWMMSQLSPDCLESFKFEANLYQIIDASLKEMSTNYKAYTEIRDRFRWDLENAIQIQFPKAKAYFFGSRETALASSESDVDVYIDIGEFHDKCDFDVDEVTEVLCQLLKFNRRNFEVREVIIGTRVPLVKIYHKQFRLYADVNCLDASGVENSKLLRLLLELDIRCKWTVTAIREWASMNLLRGSRAINSYSFAWLVLFYLMQPNVAIIPTIEKLQKLVKPTCIINEWNYSFCYDFKKVPRSSSSLTQGQLLSGFFQFYSKLDFSKYVLDSSTGVLVDRTLFEDENTLPSKFRDLKGRSVITNGLKLTTYAILLDPMALDYNVLRNVNKEYIIHFQMLCHRMLQSAPWLQ